MKRIIVVVGSIFALVLGACLPFSITSTPSPGPTVDVAGTADTVIKTAAAQTLTAQPTSTSAPLTDTATPVLESTITPTVESPTATQTPTVTPTSNVTPTLVTATSVSTNPTFALTVVGGQTELTPTLGILKYGTLPPAVPFSHITLINRSKAQAYISLQVTMNDGRHSIIEYPVQGTIKIQAPIGYYIYVAWVGGNKMVGDFNLHHDVDLSITLYKDRVVIQ